jgi:hypothetical protein
MKRLLFSLTLALAPCAAFASAPGPISGTTSATPGTWTTASSAQGIDLAGGFFDRSSRSI